MFDRSRPIPLTLLVLFIFSFSLLAPYTVYADGETPPTGEPIAAEESTPPAAEPTDTETSSVSEILAQIPDSTGLVVLGADGSTEPLASAAAAEIITTGDPMWCPVGVLPGGVGCTGSFPTFTGAGGLLTALGGGAYSGNGVIYVETTYNSSLESGNININGDVLTTLGNLTIQGGWNGVLGGATINGTSTFNGISLQISNWGGSVTLNDISILNTASTSLYVESDGNIILANVDARSDGFYGADLVNDDAAAGTVQVTNSDFSDLNNLGTDDGGLRVLSAGDVTLTGVTSNDHNNYGAFIETSGDVSVTGSTFNDQNDTGLYILSGGDVTLNNVIASNNGIAGGYINTTSGTGTIQVTNAAFDSNGIKGLYGNSSGDITLTNVVVSNNGSLGAYLNTTGDVFLNTVTAINNGGTGVAVHNPNLCDKTSGIDVTVDGGTFQNNGGFGLNVLPGPLGTLTLLNNPLFGGNTEGDYQLLLDIDCSKHEHSTEPEEPAKPIQVIELPATGGTPVEQDCEIYSATQLVLPDDTTAEIDCPLDGSSLIEEIGLDGLPAALPPGPDFVSAVSLQLDALEDEDAKVTVSFAIPEGMEGEQFSILYWDPIANDWVELPLAQFGINNFSINPDDPNDPRQVLSGVEVKDGVVSVTVNFPGIFTLVAR